MWERRTEETESGLSEEMWPTPIASTAGTSQKTLKMAMDGTAHMTLDRAILIRQMWPTPRTQMTRPVQVRGDVEKGHKSNLEEVVAVRQMWPTPQASDNRDRGNMSDPSIKRRLEIGKQIGLSTAVKPEKGSGSLNPTWVEWLMGWPLEWTALKPLETAKSHSAPPPPLSKAAGG